MIHYVYALIDPTQNNNVFYVGEGVGRRGANHLGEARLAGRRGADVDVIFENEIADADDRSKIEVIQRLQREYHFGARDLVRVIARNLSQELAFTLESFLIKNVYKPNELKNRDFGHHSERFRAFGDWEHAHFFQGPLIDHYVYFLRDPGNGEVFYVGKGIGDRYEAHFRAARSANGQDPDLGDKLVRLRTLLQTKNQEEIVRIVAHSLSKEEAFAIESLALKFAVGSSDATNAVSGHYSWRFRAKGDWEVRPGFDLPVSIYENGDPRLRDDEKHVILGTGRHKPALAMTLRFPGLVWRDEPRMFNVSTMEVSGEIEKEIDGKPEVYRIIVIIGARGMQVECRGSVGTIAAQCERLAYRNRREGRSEPFLPDAWWGNPTRNSDEVAMRISQLIGWVNSSNRDDLEQQIGIDQCDELLFVDEGLRLRLELKKFAREKTIALRNGSTPPPEPPIALSDFYLSGTSFRKKFDEEVDCLGWHFSIELCEDAVDPHSFDQERILRMRDAAIISCRYDVSTSLFVTNHFDYFDSEKLTTQRTVMVSKLRVRLRDFVARIADPKKTSKFYSILRKEYPYDWRIGVDGFSLIANNVPHDQGDLLFETVGASIAKHLDKI